MSVYLLDGKVITNGGKVATSTDCCCGTGCAECGGYSTLTVTYTFDYDDGIHVFNASDTLVLDVSTCSNELFQDVFVPVTAFGVPCFPDAKVTAGIGATCDPMTGLWGFTFGVDMGDHATICGGGGWPLVTINCGVSDTTAAGGVFPLTCDPFASGSATLVFS